MKKVIRSGFKLLVFEEKRKALILKYLLGNVEIGRWRVWQGHFHLSSLGCPTFNHCQFSLFLFALQWDFLVCPSHLHSPILFYLFVYLFIFIFSIPNDNNLRGEIPREWGSTKLVYM